LKDSLARVFRPRARYPVVVDARILLVANRVLSGKALHRVTRRAMGVSRPGTLRSALPKEGDKHA